jgi:hypothetical protein
MPPSSPNLLRRRPAAGGHWLALFVMFRLLAAGLVITVLVLHRLTDFDVLLGWVVVAYGALSVAAVLRVPGLFSRPAIWLADGAAASGLLLASGDWRSPFYLLALTALAPAVAQLPFRSALLYGAGFTVASFGVALATGWTSWPCAPRWASRSSPPTSPSPWSSRSVSRRPATSCGA